MSKITELPKEFDTAEIEERWKDAWEDSGIYKYDTNSSKETFSVDTPPPYVSAAHLHVGHAMSYTQAEILIRYKRMCGYNIFYPMGFDDNGLPTERYVEQKYKINKKKTTRSEFRKLCIEETQIGAVEYEKLWRAMGLSVDWKQRYSTIDDHCRKTSQKSFLELHGKDLLKRSDEPVLWDTHFETALAQADLETLNRKGKMYDIQFKAEDGTPLIISTTRPELIPACVAMYFNPNDERYKHLEGKNAIVPLFGHEVPIKTSDQVDMEFGTGLMQVCTFGDNEDVQKWKLDNLDTRFVMTTDGKMNALAGKYEGLPLIEARSHIVKDLKAEDLITGEQVVEQNVSVGERSNTPVEFMMVPQWFIKVMDRKEELLERAKELKWFPEFMSVRLDQWIEGLKFDWNISRQRFYGVPFPIWYVKDTNEVILADEADLPVDPTEDSPPQWAIDKYGVDNIVPETDVMDTWMTSSGTPLVNANYAGSDGRDGTMDSIYPMSLRVQAFEIIRTWLFYTLVKSHDLTNSIPWENVMISGWGLNEQGKKISKRDLEKFTDANGFNRYNPYEVIKKYGADGLRYWAAGAHLGYDLRYNEKDVKAGRKVVVKLWNVARLATMYLQDFDPNAPRPDIKDRTIEDQWLMGEIAKCRNDVTRGFDIYDYAVGKDALEKFFWMTYCDNYLELVKPRFWEDGGWDEASKISAQATLYESLEILIKLFAPYMPFITEEIYHKLDKFGEDHVSLHVAPWPDANATASGYEEKIELLMGVLRSVRKLRSDMQIGQGGKLKSVTFECSAELQTQLKEIEESILSAARADDMIFGPAETDAEIDGLKLKIEPKDIKDAA